MDDGELFKDITKQADEGNVRAIVYNPLPRALHKFKIVSSKLDKNTDGSRTIIIVGLIADDTPENGESFRVQQMVVNKDGKKMQSGMALAAGLFAAAKAAGQQPTAYAGNLEGVEGIGWLDIDSYTRGDKTYFNQVLFWGSEEPPKTSKAASNKSSHTEDAPF